MNSNRDNNDSDRDDSSISEIPKINLQGYVYAWGKNKDGELATGNCKNCLIPTPVRGIKDKNILNISSGGQHSSVVSEDGDMWIVGSSLHGKLGIEDLGQTHICTFQMVPTLRNCVVKQVACGDYHTMCLLDSGVVYAWGGTLHKKLGQRGCNPAPIQNLMEKKVVYVDCGDFHSVALTDKGELYSWGGGGSYFNKGQCGHGHLNNVENPELIKFFKGKKVSKVSAGGYHTMALLENGELYSWGSGSYGECGHGEFVDTPLPRKVTINLNQKYYLRAYDEKPKGTPVIEDISCGGHHSMILTDKGLFVCGYASHGQLGLKGTENECEPKFVYTLSNKKIIQIAAGWNHSLVLTENHDVYTCGNGHLGQLGLGTEESKTQFTFIESLRGKMVTQIFAGGNHSWVMLDHDSPIIEDYDLPSPLKGYDSPRNKDTSPMTTKGSQVFSDAIETDEQQEQNVEKKKDRILELIYTDHMMSHRFIKFTIKEDAFNDFKGELDEYIKDSYSFEAGVQFHKLQQDSEIIEEVNDFGKLISPTTKKNVRSYTLLFVSDLGKNTNFENVQRLRKTVPYQKVNSLIGEVHIVKESELKKDNAERVLSHWMLVFAERFGKTVQNLKFVEMRPDSYQ